MLSAFLALSLIGQSAASSATVEAVVTRAWEEADQADVRHEKDLEHDREEGKKYSAEVEKELKLSEDKDAIDRVQRIGKVMADIANRTRVQASWGDKRLSPFEYTFKVVQGKDINAFSLPGGYIYFYDGLVKYTESDDELAGVLAHEIAHASLRHVATMQREQSRVSAIQIPAILIAIFAGGAKAAGPVIQLGQLGSQAVFSGWSQKAEKAADFGGFQYMLQSKYNPTAMLTMMERLAIDERNGPKIEWGIFRTHPPSRERADALLIYLKKAQIPIQRSKVSSSFRTTLKPADDGTVEILFGDHPLVKLAGEDAIKRADEAMVRLNAFFDATPDLYDVQDGSDGLVMGRRQALIKLTRDDAIAASKDLASLKSQTVRRIQTMLFTIGYRVWDVGS